MLIRSSILLYVLMASCAAQDVIIVGPEMVLSGDDSIQYTPNADVSKDAEIIVLVDTSSSMQRNEKAIVQFINDAVPQLKKATKRYRIRMLPFSSPDKPAELGFYNEAALRLAFRRGGSSGGLVKALEVLTEKVTFRAQTRRIMLVFGDSGSIGSDAEAQKAAKIFHEKFNCTMFMVCKPRDMTKSRNAMDKIAKLTGGGVYPTVEANQKSDDLSVQPDWNAWLKAP
jgi:hypothetical protein